MCATDTDAMAFKVDFSAFARAHSDSPRFLRLKEGPKKPFEVWTLRLFSTAPSADIRVHKYRPFNDLHQNAIWHGHCCMELCQRTVQTLEKRETMMNNRVLIVDDELAIVEGLTMLLEAEAFESTGALDAATASELLAATFFPVILADLRLNSTEEGLHLLDEVRRLSPRSRVVTISAYATPEMEEEVRRRGATKVLQKPVDSEVILTVIRELLDEFEREAAGQEPLDLEQLYVATQRLLHSIPRRRYGFTQAQAEDVVQQAWLLFLEKRGLIRAPRSWLAGTIVNLCRQELDRARRAGEDAGDELALVSDPRNGTSADVLAVRQALGQLDERGRDLCEWIGLEGYSYEEVSNAIAISLGSVGPLYIRAKGRLRRILTTTAAPN
jgi:RNA polymerase sigma factor (sigma-70 family)